MTLFLLIEWINDTPKTWSVVSSSLLVDGTLRKSKKLAGRLVEVQWAKTVHSGLVVQQGTNEGPLNDHADMLALAECNNESQAIAGTSRRVTSVEESHALTSKTANTRKRKTDDRAHRIHKVLQEVEDSSGDVQEHSNLSPPVLDNSEDIGWNEKFEDSQSRLQELRRKYKKLKKAHKLCTTDDAVEILPGSNVKLLHSEIMAMKTISSSITFFARNLFRRVFHPEDIVGRSLLGRKSTAVENHVPLPSVDAQKRDAVIDFSLRTYKFELPPPTAADFLKMKKEIKLTKSRIIKSLSDFVREENAKLKKSTS